jgi:hypothetical protein
MSQFPRDVPDIIRIENDEIVVSPSKLDNLEIDIPENFDEATILTHCNNCLKKHELSYSHKFPDEISFNCAECSETNIVTSREHGYYSSVDSALIDRVRRRDSFVAGSEHSNTQHSQELIEKEQTLNRVFNFIRQTYITVLAVLWLCLIIAAIPATEISKLCIIIVIPLIAIGILNAIVDSTLEQTVSDRVKNYLLPLPRDPHQQFQRDPFIDGLESQTKISEEYTGNLSETVTTEETHN